MPFKSDPGSLFDSSYDNFCRDTFISFNICLINYCYIIE